MSSSQSAGNVNQLPSHQVDSLYEDEELYTSPSARHRSGKQWLTCSEMMLVRGNFCSGKQILSGEMRMLVHNIVQVSSGITCSG